MSTEAFDRETHDFLVTKGKFMTNEHLIHLKEDPKVILNLYRIFMLKHRMAVMSRIDKVAAAATRGGKRKKSVNEAGELEESDYSDSDF